MSVPSMPYVSSFGNFLILENVSEDLIAQIKHPPLSKNDEGNYEADLGEFTQEEEIKLLETLNNLGFAFSAGRGWPPSDIFEEYRERGLLSGTYKKIEWRGPGDWFIEER
jgi:hypothetical protein